MATKDPNKGTEYGGADTTKTKGIQPNPHVVTPEEKLRLMYSTDPMSEDGIAVPDGVNPDGV